MREEALNIQGLHVNYKIAGEGPALVILHGWGSSSASWSEIQESLAGQGFLVIVPDLPGFGLSAPPESAWGIAEYTKLVFQLTEKVGLKKFSLAGHSFGGQIAVQFAVDYPKKVEKLILLAAAGVRREPGKKVRIFSVIAKILNVFLSVILLKGARDLVRKIGYRLIGRRDYFVANAMMREVLAKVTREDLTPIFSKVQAPTLILWGDKDTATPIADAFLMREHIKNSSLHVLPGIGHRLRAEAPWKLLEFIPQFLRK
ncbi:MAG: alpha/beta hydrolase [bacterium]|nr:alpha/beta hydrolase [bacterium]